MKTERLLRIKDVCHQTGFCRSHIYNLIGKGTFPLPVGLGRARRWRQSDINHFISNLPVVNVDGRLK
ncbi:helix-turn-helix transcriptional regulator [Iodidimonas gelatinilytica]|uniref:helix-turn-helix transcriptional regulator n=1 Tax=Iodidimonas gelatinilytica TaxID=1236966 RepID=UPI001230E084